MKRVKKTSLIALVLSAVLILASCGDENGNGALDPDAPVVHPPIEYEVTYAIFAFPTSLDPFFFTGTAGNLMMANIYDGLMFSFMGDTRDVRPLLAERMERSDCGFEFTFWLRDNIYFHNGEPVTIDCVVYSYERWMEAPLSREAAQIVDTVVADHADNSVTITVTSPTPTAILEFAFIPIIPESVFGPNGDPDMASPIDPINAVGAGAYRVVEFIQDYIIVLEAVEGSFHEDAFLGGNPIHTRRITYRFIPDQNARMIAFLAGDVVSIPDPTPEDIAYFYALQQEQEARGEFAPIRISFVEDTFRHGIGVNMFDPIVGARDGTPEEQERALQMRRAMSHAVNRQSLNMASFGGFADDTIRQLVHPLTEGHIPNMPYFPYDPDRARAYFEMTGFHEDPDFYLTLRYMSDDRWSTAFAIVVQDYLRRVGIPVELIGRTTAAHNEDIWTHGAFQITFMPYAPIIAVPDIAFRSPFHSTSGWNPFNFADPRVDYLLEAARLELDDDLRVSLYEEINIIVTQSLAFIPFMGAQSATLISGRWHGYFSSLTTPFPKLFKMWWEEDGIWEPNDGLPYLNGADLTTYTVEHFRPNADGTWPATPTYVTTSTGLNNGFGVTSTPADMFEGYELDPYVSEYNLTINPDGSTVARYFYRPIAED